MRFKYEVYQDYIARLFPSDKVDENGERYVPRTVTFQVTDSCNLNCTYCYQQNKGKNSMSFQTAKKTIDLLLSSTSQNNKYINPDISQGVILEFIGGEPLLEIDLITQITDYFIEQCYLKKHPWLTRFRISICSNGVLYFDPRVQEFLKEHLEHLSFCISIDGNKELHDSCRIFSDGSGSYDVAMKASKHFREVLGGIMGSKMTLCPQNVNFVYEALVNLIIEGYDEIMLNCIFEKGWEQEHATTLYYQLKKVADYVLDNNLENDLVISMFDETSYHAMNKYENQNWCGGTGNMLAIDYKGDIFPCLRYMESSLGDTVPPLIIGDIYKGFMHNEKQIECVNCLKCVTRESQSTRECFECPIAAGCAWCSAYNYQEFGTVNKRATYICEMHKAEALANVYYWNKLFKKRKDNKQFKNNVPDEWALNIITKEELDLLKKMEEKL